MTCLLLTVWFLLLEHELFLQGNFIHRHIGFVYRISSFFSQSYLSLSLLLSLKLINTVQGIKVWHFFRKCILKRLFGYSGLNRKKNSLDYLVALNSWFFFFLSALENWGRSSYLFDLLLFQGHPSKEYMG